MYLVSTWFIYLLARGTRQEINRQRVVQIIFTQKLTGAPNVPSAGQYERSSSNEQPKGISNMVKARSNLAAQTVRDVFAVGALVCWPYNPLFNCLMTHRSSGMQAGRVDLLVCCRSGLENACKTVRRKFHATAYSCHKWFVLPEHTSNNACLFAQSSSKLCKFVLSLLWVRKIITLLFFPEKK